MVVKILYGEPLWLRLNRAVLMVLLAAGLAVSAMPAVVILTDCETNRVLLLNGGKFAARITLGIEDRILWTGTLEPWTPSRQGFDIPGGGFIVSVEFPESDVAYTEHVGYTSPFDGITHVIFVDERGASTGYWEFPMLGEEPILLEFVRVATPIALQALSCLDKRFIEGRPL